MQGFWSATSTTFDTTQASGEREKTFADLYSFIERDYRNNQRKTFRNVKGAWEAHLKPVFGAQSISRYDPALVESYIDRRLEAGAKNASINRELSYLKRMASLAMQLLATDNEKLLSALLRWSRVKGLKERNVRQGFLKDGEYHALATATAKAGVWLRAMFECACTYGWRRGELVGMRVAQVDLEARTIALNPGETKNDEGRMVEMTEEVYQLLQAAIDGKAANEYVFTRSKSRRQPDEKRAIRDFRKAWKRATDEAGLVGLYFHDLRRTGVRNMRRRGISDRVAMLITGHKTHSMLQRYSIVDSEDIRDAVRKMEAWQKERDRLAELEKQQKLFQDSELLRKRPN